jgi:hypothetical protein
MGLFHFLDDRGILGNNDLVGLVDFRVVFLAGLIQTLRLALLLARIAEEEDYDQEGCEQPSQKRQIAEASH